MTFAVHPKFEDACSSRGQGIMDEPGSEKREARRHRVLKQGRLAFDNGGAVDCTVRNLSDTGARIEVISPVGLPEIFTLLIPADDFSRRCHAVWNDNKRIGVVFD
jgi:PilZ domain